MNVEQQLALIRNQVADIAESDHVRILEEPDPFHLRLEIVGRADRRYTFLLDLHEYDIEPPRLSVLDENGNVTWDREKLPPQPFVNGTKHPVEQRDFFCIPGTHDYHSHPLHSHELWDSLRSTHPLAAIVSRITKELRAALRISVRIAVPNLGMWPLKSIDIVFENGETANLEIPNEVLLALRRLDIVFRDTRAIRVEDKDVA